MIAKERRFDLCLLRDLQRIVDLNAEVSDRRFQFRVAKKQLHCAQILHL